MENYTVKIYENGKITLPMQIRDTLNLQKGDELMLSVIDGRVVMTTFDSLLSHAQDKVKHYHKGDSLVEELLNVRKQEADDLK